MNKLSISATIVISSLILGGFYYASQVSKQKSIENQQRIELAQIEKEKEDELLRKEEKENNLSMCLEESEYQRSTAHLALCGDPNVSKSPSSCFRVFGGTKNYANVTDNYKREFLNSFPDLPENASIEELLDNFKQREEILNKYWETCNCGLEKTRRDGLDTDRNKRDQICIQKYSE